MTGFDGGRFPDRLPEAFTTPGSSSFVEFVRSYAPQLLPGYGLSGHAADQHGHIDAPHGTTIVALTHAGGMVMAGDRRATMGSTIAHRRMEKVFTTDEYSVIGIAGTAGIAVELVRLFQLELEHYEKIEGTLLSLEGKANRLAAMVRANLPMALQGIVALPLFGGYDAATGQGRLFSYDAVGGRYEEQDYYSVGSGSVYAQGSMKKLWQPRMDTQQAVRVAMHALIDAADDDTATGGPDPARQIYPVVMTVDEHGATTVPPAELAAVAAQIQAEPERNLRA